MPSLTALCSCFENDRCLVIFLIYVDDIIVIGNDSSLIQHSISCLNSQFSLKDLGDLSFFLGIQVVRTPSALHLSQSKYINDLLARANMSDCKSIHSHMAFGAHFSLSEGELLETPTEYKSNLVGAL